MKSALGLFALCVLASQNVFAGACDYKGDAIDKAKKCLEKVAVKEFGTEAAAQSTAATLWNATSSGSDLFLIQLNYSHEMPGKVSVTGVLECNEKTGELEVRSISYFLANSYGVRSSREVCK